MSSRKAIRAAVRIRAGNAPAAAAAWRSTNTLSTSSGRASPRRSGHRHVHGSAAFGHDPGGLHRPEVGLPSERLQGLEFPTALHLIMQVFGPVGAISLFAQDGDPPWQDLGPANRPAVACRFAIATVFGHGNASRHSARSKSRESNPEEARLMHRAPQSTGRGGERRHHPRQMGRPAATGRMMYHLHGPVPWAPGGRTLSTSQRRALWARGAGAAPPPPFRSAPGSSDRRRHKVAGRNRCPSTTA